jgi:hypothetical protein
MAMEQIQEWSIVGGMHNANNQIASNGVAGVDSRIPSFVQEAYGTEMASIGSANHFSGGCRPCIWFLKSRCLHGISCQYCHMNHKTEERKRKGNHRKSELRLSKDPVCQRREENDCHVKSPQPQSTSRVNLDPLDLLTELLKVRVNEDNMDLGKSKDLSLSTLFSDESIGDGTCLARAVREDIRFPSRTGTSKDLSLTTLLSNTSIGDDTCLARAVREDIRFPNRMGTLPKPSRTELLDPFCHSSTNPVEPLGLQKAGRAEFDGGYLKHLQELGSQCGKDAQEHHIRELENQNAFLKMCLMQCVQAASDSL